MGRIVLVGNGWHPPLFRAEVNALAGHSEIFHPRIVSVSQSNKNLENISGAAGSFKLTWAVSEGPGSQTHCQN